MFYSNTVYEKRQTKQLNILQYFYLLKNIITITVSSLDRDNVQTTILIFFRHWERLNQYEFEFANRLWTVNPLDDKMETFPSNSKLFS